MNKSEAINELAAALAKAQGAMKAAIKDSANPFFKSKYADLASVVDAIKGPLAANGLSYVQSLGSDGEAHYIETMLMHASGQWLSDRVRIVVSKPNDPQAFGSAVTYFRRYSLQSITGTPADDDDGNAATGKPGVHRPTDGAMDGLDAASATRAKTLASGLVDAWDAGDMTAAAEIWEGCKDSDIKIAAWGELGQFPKQRNTFKAFLVQRDKERGVNIG